MSNWLPFYSEVVQELATYEHRQAELIALLREMKAQGLPSLPLKDEDANGAVEMRAIDPFTFLATFHRTGDDARRDLWKALRDKWNVSEAVPDDFGGLPTVHAQASWFFPFEIARHDDDIPTLWSLFQIARESPPALVDEALWTRALEVSGVGLAKLTTGLFWINPRDYLSLDGVMLPYLARFGIVPNLKTITREVAAYSRLLAHVHEELNREHVDLSRQAWNTRDAPKRAKRYWAGGHDWSRGSQLERFKSNHEWQLGYTEQHPQAIAVRLIALFREIEVGDEIVIKGCGAQHLRVHYVGCVDEIDAATQTLKLKALPGRPLHQGPRPVGKGAGNWTESLLEVKRPQDIKLIFGAKGGGVFVDEDENNLMDENDLIEETVLPNFPLNTILYGPPGTGKTYTSVTRALEIIDGRAPASRVDCSSRFEKLRVLGRIGFVTFHQSFAYEEFIEGLRPVIDESVQSGARYEVRPGALKNIALQALGACLETAQPGRATFEDVWQKLLDKIEDDGSWELPGIGSSRYRLELTPSGNLRGTNVAQGSTAQSPYNATLTNIESVWSALRNGPTATHNVVHNILKKGAHTNLIGAVVEELKRIEDTVSSPSNLIKDPIQAAQSFLSGSEDYRLKRDLSRTERFVLVIDEINRGNISKILGELITLLENDKRLGRLNALRVTLPYSGDTFALPPNLYVLGTMNTADKSLALLDVALRRRFTFEEMAPDFSSKVCPTLPPGVRDVLEALNTRLMLLLDREHRLGHAFFIDVTNEAGFNQVFARQIVPLLQEFFYNDWEGLRSVLGESGQGKIVVEMTPIQGVRGRNRFAWWSDLGRSEPNFYSALRANYDLSDPATTSQIEAATDDTLLLVDEAASAPGDAS